jgi:hypothetical protein
LKQQAEKKEQKAKAETSTALAQFEASRKIDFHHFDGSTATQASKAI